MTDNSTSAFQAVLFDMDGTLVDTQEQWHEAEHHIATSYGNGWDAAHSHELEGASLDQEAEFLRRRCGVQLTHEQIRQLVISTVSSAFGNGFDWMPGARELVKQTHSHALAAALVTSSPQDVAEFVLAELPHNSFDTVVTGDQITYGKPDPEPYRLAIWRLGVSANKCLAIEDSMNGVRAAVAAGCRVILVGSQESLTEAHLQVPSLAGLDMTDLMSNAQL